MNVDRFIAGGMTALLAFSIPVLAIGASPVSQSTSGSATAQTHVSPSLPMDPTVASPGNNAQRPSPTLPTDPTVSTRVPDNSGAVIDNTTSGSAAPLGTNANSSLTTVDFKSLDIDGNHTVTRAEFEHQGLSESLFATIDANHDGFLSQAEVSSYGPVTRSNH